MSVHAAPTYGNNCAYAWGRTWDSHRPRPPSKWSLRVCEDRASTTRSPCYARPVTPSGTAARRRHGPPVEALLSRVMTGWSWPEIPPEFLDMVGSSEVAICSGAALFHRRKSPTFCGAGQGGAASRRSRGQSSSQRSRNARTSIGRSRGDYTKVTRPSGSRPIGSCWENTGDGRSTDGVATAPPPCPAHRRRRQGWEPPTDPTGTSVEPLCVVIIQRSDLTVGPHFRHSPRRLRNPVADRRRGHG